MTRKSKKNISAEPQQSTPPQLTPPDAADIEQAKPPGFKRLLVGGLGLLLIVLALLVLFLPINQTDKLVSTQTEPSTLPPSQAPPASPAIPPLVTSESSEKQEVDRLMTEWLRKQAVAEAENIVNWGEDRYLAATAAAKGCDQLLSKQQYLEAQQACQTAINHLDELTTTKDSLLEEALGAGNRALLQGKPETAERFFQRALAIDGNNEQATSGLQRAADLPGVLQLLEEGMALERTDDLDGALLAFAAAVKRDPLFPPAQQALSRTKEVIETREFQKSMSRALQAFTNGRLSAAEQALRQAQSLRPQDPAVQDLTQQLAQKRRANNLAALRTKTEKLEQEERWDEALKFCEQALAIDSRATFATDCKERVSSRIDWDLRLVAILAQPTRLYEDGPLDEARQVLASAAGLNPHGPRLTDQTEQLARLIAVAEAEVEVVILSDALTEVAIYHFGRLGAFLEKKFVLRTGDYTATGNRDGFRDVRQVLKVRPGKGQQVFTIRCEEPI